MYLKNNIQPSLSINKLYFLLVMNMFYTEEAEWIKNRYFKVFCIFLKKKKKGCNLGFPRHTPIFQLYHFKYWRKVCTTQQTVYSKSLYSLQPSRTLGKFCYVKLALADHQFSKLQPPDQKFLINTLSIQACFSVLAEHDRSYTE